MMSISFDLKGAYAFEDGYIQILFQKISIT